MTNQATSFFSKISPLFNDVPPALVDIVQPEIDKLSALISKFSDLELSGAWDTILSSVAGGVPMGNAISAGTVRLKVAAMVDGITITDDEAHLIAQALTKNIVGAVNAAVAAPVADMTEAVAA